MRKQLILGLVIIMLLTACEKEHKEKTIEVNSISLSTDELSIIEGDSKTIMAVVLPENASDKTVLWSSSNEDLARVSDKGIIEALKVGKLQIYASCNSITKLCNLTVVERYVGVKSIILNHKKLTKNVNEKFRMSAEILPDNASNKSITWSSSNPSIARIFCSKGGVETLAEGECDIIASSIDGVMSRCKLIVEQKDVALKGIAFEKEVVDVDINIVFYFKILYTPNNTTERGVRWFSSNPDILSVSEDGMMVGRQSGESILKAVSIDGKHETRCKIIVHNVVDVRKVYINTDYLKLKEGEQSQLSAIITPRNATNKNIFWTSSNDDVAKIDSNGLVRAIKRGKAIIMLRSESKNRTYECEVNVI